MAGMSALVGREITDYSEQVAGDRQNHGRAVQFDVTDGYVGITAFDNDGGVDRVLLTPKQLTALRVFLRRAKQHRRKAR